MSAAPITPVAAPDAGPPALQLEPDQIDVWLCFLDTLDAEAIDSCRFLLNRDELQRCERFENRAAREQAIAGRALTRIALSSYANVPERAWVFVANEHGRPSIGGALGGCNLQFNLSHTTGVVALTVGRLPEIGIDVEAVERQVDIHGIAQTAFSRREVEALARCRPDLAHDLFFRIWTLKEAYIKARGTGFSLPPRTFTLADLDGAISLDCASDCDPHPERWRLLACDAGPGRKMALAIGTRAPQRIRSIVCRSLAPRIFDFVDEFQWMPGAEI